MRQRCSAERVQIRDTAAALSGRTPRAELLDEPASHARPTDCRESAPRDHEVVRTQRAEHEADYQSTDREQRGGGAAESVGRASGTRRSAAARCVPGCAGRCRIAPSPCGRVRIRRPAGSLVAPSIRHATARLSGGRALLRVFGARPIRRTCGRRRLRAGLFLVRRSGTLARSGRRGCGCWCSARCRLASCRLATCRGPSG